MVSSISTEKLVYEKNGYRTPTYAPAIETIIVKTMS